MSSPIHSFASVRIRGLNKAFGRQTVLRGIDLDLEESGIVAILGPNASGKTTLIKCLLGMVLPDAGFLEVAGEPVAGKWRYRRHIGYLPQAANFPPNLRVSELIAMMKDLRPGAVREDALIERFGLEQTLQRRIGHLSGGTRQKVNLVLAFMYDAPLLVLDEPTAGLDPLAMVRLNELLREERDRGKTVLVTTHIIGFVERMADELLFLLEGQIRFRGTPAHLRERFGTEDLEQAIGRAFGANGIALPEAGEAERAPAAMERAKARPNANADSNPDANAAGDTIDKIP